MHSLSKLSDQDLLDKTKKLVLEETQKTLEVLNHLREVERRKLFLKSGFPSLFEYAVHELKYSHSAAYRRIEAMRLIKDLPEVENKILTGSLNLTTVSLAQSFFKKQSKVSAAKLELIAKLENKSTRDVQKELVSLDPEFIPKEKLRSLNENTFELKLVIDEKLKSKLDKLKSLMSHKNPSFNYQELIDELADQALKKLDPAVKSQRRALPAPKVENKNSRYIPSQIKKIVWKRDQGRCQYMDAKSKRQCGSTHFIQIDHIKPYSQNGSSQDPQNLRLLCGQHNRWRYSQETSAKWAKNWPKAFGL